MSGATVTLTVVTAGGDRRELEVETGQTLMEALRDLDVGVEAICGGNMSCATCHVVIDPEWAAALPGHSDGEQDLLDSLTASESTSRLSCQVLLTESHDGLRLKVALQE